MKQEFGQLGVPIGGQLEYDHPFLGPLDPIFPPERARDRPCDLRAGGQPGLHGIVSQLHSLGPGVGRGLNVQKSRRAIRCASGTLIIRRASGTTLTGLFALRSHSTRSYAAAAVTFAS